MVVPQPAAADAAMQALRPLAEEIRGLMAGLGLVCRVSGLEAARKSYIFLGTNRPVDNSRTYLLHEGHVAGLTYAFVLETWIPGGGGAGLFQPSTKLSTSLAYLKSLLERVQGGEGSPSPAGLATSTMRHLVGCSAKAWGPAGGAASRRTTVGLGATTEALAVLSLPDCEPRNMSKLRSSDPGFCKGEEFILDMEAIGDPWRLSEEGWIYGSARSVQVEGLLVRAPVASLIVETLKEVTRAAKHCRTTQVQ